MPLLPEETAVASFGDVHLTQKRVIGPSSSLADGYTAILIQDVVSCSVGTRRPAAWTALLGSAVALAGLAAFFQLHSQVAGWAGFIVGAATLIWYRDQTANFVVVRSANGEIGQRVSDSAKSPDDLVNRIQAAKLEQTARSRYDSGTRSSFAR